MYELREIAKRLAYDRSELHDEFDITFRLFLDTSNLPPEKQALRNVLEAVDKALYDLESAIIKRDEIVSRLRGVDPATD